MMDEERTHKLAENLLVLLQEHYKAGPISRDRVFEALNALALAVAVTLQGTDQRAVKFFMEALEINAADAGDYLKRQEGNN
jgi:hypothetical protein